MLSNADTFFSFNCRAQSIKLIWACLTGFFFVIMHSILSLEISGDFSQVKSVGSVKQFYVFRA